MKNPFQRAAATAAPLTILLYGVYGSGKTRAALTFPRVAMVDTEGGSKRYRGHPDVPPFAVLDAKTLADMKLILAFIQEDRGKTYDTLVIDTVTVLYDVEKAALTNNHQKDMTFKDWAKLNSRMKAFYHELEHLPVHVVVVARQSTEYDGSATELRRIGQKPDSDKALPYTFDFIIRMQADLSGVVEKSRGVALGNDFAAGGGQYPLRGQNQGLLPSVNWSVFEPVASAYQRGSHIATESEAEAAEREADMTWDDDAMTEFAQYWHGQGITNGPLLKALGVKGLREWRRGRKAADEAVKGYFQLQPIGAPDDLMVNSTTRSVASSPPASGIASATGPAPQGQIKA